MKKMKNITLVIFALSLVFLASCSDDDNNSISENGPKVSTSFPSSVNSYWVFDSYYYDSTNTKQFASRDSIVNTAILTKDGKSNVILQTQYSLYPESDSYEISDSTYYVVESNKLYINSDILSKQLPSDQEAGENMFGDILNIDQDWLLVANSDASNWDIYSKTIPESPVKFMEIPFLVNGTMDIKGQKSTVENVTIGSQTVKAQKYIVNMDIKLLGKVEYSGQKIDAVNITIKGPMTYWIADGIGIVKKSSAGMTIAFKFTTLAKTFMQLEDFESTEGKDESNLIKYSIK